MNLRPRVKYALCDVQGCQHAYAACWTPEQAAYKLLGCTRPTLRLCASHAIQALTLEVPGSPSQEEYDAWAESQVVKAEIKADGP